MSNIYGLKNGQTFIINPSEESNPTEARQSKKTFLLGINLADLSTDKTVWSAEAVRKLATGLVPVTCPKADGKGTKRSTKDILIARLESYIAEEKALLVAKSSEVLETLELNSYSTTHLLKLISTMRGDDLVNSIELSLFATGYANATICKNLVPSIVKVLADRYEGSDKSQVIGGIYSKFRSMTKELNNEYKAKVAANNAAQTLVTYKPLIDFATDVVTRIKQGTSLSWKEVSIALALVTGRRMAEIHGKATSFTTNDTQGTLTFKGQLKTKERATEESYDIPVLLPTEDVLLLWSELCKTDRQFDNPSDVNRKLSKGFSTELPVSIGKLFKSTGVTKYKDLRDIYAARILKDKPVGVSASSLISQVLGHGEDDIQTASSYQKIDIV